MEISDSELLEAEADLYECKICYRKSGLLIETCCNKQVCMNCKLRFRESPLRCCAFCRKECGVAKVYTRKKVYACKATVDAFIQHAKFVRDKSLF